MTKIVLICIFCVLACTSAQRITTIHLDGVQYFISRMNPYSPELNYFLAYQYCRSLGLQLASFETKEKAESMTMYLKNAGYGTYDFWTSGNRLGTGMFLWMSTGLPFNATFDFFENTADAIQAGLLDPDDHNSNTAPQRTARDSSSGAEKGCVVLKQPTLKWMPEDCSAVKDFICEQTRCYYYNYGSIPVSSAQGRPVTSTTSSPVNRMTNTKLSTTPLPLLRSGQNPFSKRSHHDDEAQLSFVPLKVVGQERSVAESHKQQDDKADDEAKTVTNSNKFNEDDTSDDDKDQSMKELPPHSQEDTDRGDDEEDDEATNDENLSASAEDEQEDPVREAVIVPEEKLTNLADSAQFPGVEIRLKQISQEIEKLSNEHPRQQNTANILHHDNNDVDRQSFLSLTDLIRTLRPNDKQIIPQIDSDYSNAMRVLGETSEVVNNEDSHKFYDKDIHQ